MLGAGIFVTLRPTQAGRGVQPKGGQGKQTNKKGGKEEGKNRAGSLLLALNEGS
eukprot:m.265517 g.265517  ORF g.265517 m.265517 type:complete len:54 (+) comp19263_c0_seq5:452-613(+)